MSQPQFSWTFIEWPSSLVGAFVIRGLPEKGDLSLWKPWIFLSWFVATLAPETRSGNSTCALALGGKIFGQNSNFSWITMAYTPWQHCRGLKFPYFSQILSASTVWLLIMNTIFHQKAGGRQEGVNGVNRLATKCKKYYRLPTGKEFTDFRYRPTLSIFFSERRVYCIFFLPF